MKLGEAIEAAVWITGDETPETRTRYKQDVSNAIDAFCSETGFLHGPVRFIEKSPGEDRVPAVPEHIEKRLRLGEIEGPRIKLLVAESEIIAPAPQTNKGSFVVDLDKVDLEHLRAVTRNAHLQHFDKTITDPECDDVIERIGPEVALTILRRTVH